MIQRKQTLFLVLVFLCGLLASFLNLFTITYYEVEYTMSALGGMTSPEEDLLWPVYLFPSIITFATAAIASIVMYKNRKNQMKFVMLNNWVIVAAILGMIGFLFQGIGQLGVDAVFNFSAASLLLPMALMFNILALRGIKADDDLIRSVDRIR